MITEINFDGIIGPTHNYAGLSRGNIASASHAGDASQPRAAALKRRISLARASRLKRPPGAPGTASSVRNRVLMGQACRR